MMNNDLNNKLLKDLKDFTGKMKDNKDSYSNIANENLSKVEDGEMKDFLQDSLKKAIAGKLKPEEFIEQFKNMNNAH
jgi:hypothetical protein